MQQCMEGPARLDKKRDAREAEIVASEEKSRKVLDERTERFSPSRAKKDTKNKDLKANLKTELTAIWVEREVVVVELETEVATFREEKKVAVKEVKEKENTKAAGLKEKAEITLAQSKRRSTRSQQKQKAIVPPFTF